MKVTKQRIIAIVLFVLSLLGILIGQIISQPNWIGICVDGDYTCISKFPVFELGHPLFFGIPYLALVSFFLLFLRKEIFSAWGKYAIWYLPLAIIILAIAPPLTSGFGPDRTQLAIILGQLYVIISILVIAYKYIRLHVHKKKTN